MFLMEKDCKLELAPDRQRAIVYVDSIVDSILSFLLISVVHCLFLI